jgi:O-phosphoseryl-tRNA(Cys) synthetase
MAVFKSAVTHPANIGHGREGFYFGENGGHSLYEVGRRIAEALVELGKGRSVEPTTFTEEEVAKYFGVRNDYLPPQKYGLD